MHIEIASLNYSVCLSVAIFSSHVVDRGAINRRISPPTHLMYLYCWQWLSSAVCFWCRIFAKHRFVFMFEWNEWNWTTFGALWVSAQSIFVWGHRPMISGWVFCVLVLCRDQLLFHCDIFGWLRVDFYLGGKVKLKYPNNLMDEYVSCISIIALITNCSFRVFRLGFELFCFIFLFSKGIKYVKKYFSKTHIIKSPAKLFLFNYNICF